MKKCDLLVVSERIPPDFAGGGKRAYNQSVYMAELGYHVNILTFTSTVSTVKNLKIVHLPEIKLKTKKIFQFLIIPIHFIFVFIYLLLNRPRLVYCLNASYLSYIILIFCKLLRIKTVVGTTLTDSDDPLTIKKRTLGSLKFKIFNFGEKIVCISPSLMDRCIQSGIKQERLSLIPNPVNINIFSPLPDKEKRILKISKGFKENDIILLNVGIIIGRKRTDYIVKIFKKLANLDENYKLVILGPTNKNDENKNYTNKVKKLISEFNLEDRVLIKGDVQDVNSYMRISDLFLFASEQEGFGNVLIEAMACELPVITTNIPGITEYIIENGINGYNVNSEKEFLESILNILKNDKEYKAIKLRCRLDAVNKFSYAKVMQQYFVLFNEILGEDYFN